MNVAIGLLAICVCEELGSKNSENAVNNRVADQVKVQNESEQDWHSEVSLNHDISRVGHVQTVREVVARLATVKRPLEADGRETVVAWRAAYSSSSRWASFFDGAIGDLRGEQG